MADASTNAPRTVGIPFEKGNKASKGNPLAGKVASLRAALYEAVTREEIVKVWKALYSKSLEGDPAALALLLKWCLVKPIEPALEEGESSSEETTIKLIITSKDKAKAVVIPDEPGE